MATTDPITGFLLHDTSDIIVPLSGYINDAIDPINDWAALRMRYDAVWANATDMGAALGMIEGSRGYRVDTKIEMRYNTTLATWKEWNSDWITWTTAPSNLTIGTGGSAISTQQYKYVNGRVIVRVKYILGTTGSSMGTSPSINLPFSINIVMSTEMQIGEATLLDSSASVIGYGKMRVFTSSPTQINIASYTGTLASISSTAPWTWASSDSIVASVWVDPA